MCCCLISMNSDASLALAFRTLVQDILCVWFVLCSKNLPAPEIPVVVVKACFEAADSDALLTQNSFLKAQSANSELACSAFFDALFRESPAAVEYCMPLL